MSALLDYAGSTERAADRVPRLEGELAWARESLAASETYNNDLLTTLRRKEEELVAAHTELVSAHAKLARVGEHVVGRILLRRIKR